MTKRALALTPAIILFLFLSAQHAGAQIGHSIRGKVRDGANGANLPRAVVDLQTGNGQPIGKTIAGEEGDFSFGGLIDNSYQIVVSSPDYQTVVEQVDFGSDAGENRPGETRSLDITLMPNPTARLAPGRVTFAQNVPAQARAAYERAVKLHREGQSVEAFAAMQEAVKIFPDYFDARFALGGELYKRGRLDEAIVELDHARRANPRSEHVYYAFGLILMRQRKFAVAARVFQEAARLNPKEAQYLLLRGMALIDHATVTDPSKSKEAAAERDFALTEAEKSLTRAYELSGKKLAAVHQQLARLYERKGDNARAATELEQYLRKNPKAPNAAAIREAISKLRAPAP